MQPKKVWKDSRVTCLHTNVYNFQHTDGDKWGVKGMLRNMRCTYIVIDNNIWVISVGHPIYRWHPFDTPKKVIEYIEIIYLLFKINFFFFWNC